MDFTDTHHRLLVAAGEAGGLTIQGTSVILPPMGGAKPKQALATPSVAPEAPAPMSMKELFEQRNTTKPGSKEEDQAVDRIMEAMFPGVSHASR